MSSCWIDNDDEYDKVKEETLASWKDVNSKEFPELVKFVKKAKAEGY